MDNLTHTLVGIALSRAWFKNRMVFATSAMIVAANAPDLDLLWSGRGIGYLKYHRGVAHSLLALPVWALLFALALPAIARWRKRTPPPWWMAALLALIGVGSHLLLDWTNAYGIRLLAPLNQHWFSLDLVPIVDPWIWLLLAACLGVPLLLGLIGNEVGARKNPHRASGVVALLVLFAWWGVRYRQHQAALDLLANSDAATLFEGQIPLDWSAFPTMASPFAWQGVVNLPRSYFVAQLDTPFDTTAAALTPLRTFIKPPRTPAVAAAEATPTAAIFLWFARYPLADAENLGDQTRVTFTDLRFSEGSRRPQMHAQITLTPSNVVTAQTFNWN